MSLYSDYIKARGISEIIETDKGFATYRFEGNACYIVDIYTIPEARKTGEASRLADSITEAAKAKGCRLLLGSVAPEARGAADSCKVLTAYGFKELKREPRAIWFIKEI